MTPEERDAVRAVIKADRDLRSIQWPGHSLNFVMLLNEYMSMVDRLVGLLEVEARDNGQEGV